MSLLEFVWGKSDKPPRRPPSPPDSSPEPPIPVENKRSTSKSVVSRLTGKAAEQPKPSTVESLSRMRVNVENFTKKEDQLTMKIEAERREVLKFMTAKQKEKAMISAKRKKLYEQQLTNISNQKNNLEEMIIKLETANMSISGVAAMKEGAEAMKSIKEKFSIEDVDDVTESVRNELISVDQINEALSTPFGMSRDTSDDALEAELRTIVEQDQQEHAEALLADLESKVLPQFNSAHSTPSTSSTSSMSRTPASSTSKMPAVPDDELEQLKRLEAEMAL